MRDIGELIGLITRDITRMLDVDELVQEDLITLRNYILKQSVALGLMKYFGRISVSKCSICLVEDCEHTIVVSPTPCMHAVHLLCLAKKVQHQRDFICPACSPSVYIGKKMTGFTIDCADFDLKKTAKRELESIDARIEKKQGEEEARQVCRLSKFEEVASELSLSYNSCEKVTTSPDMSLAMDIEFANKKANIFRKRA